jgi:site-specific DNA-methyltransferase (adenine-specific)
MSVTLHLHLGDCVEVLKGYDDGSIGTVVSDPPYDLTAVSRGGSARQAGTGPYGRHELGTKNPRGGFMGKEWDGTGIAFSADLWDEVYRVLRPGGVVKAFSGTRTFHRMAAAMQDAGFLGLHFEAWSYGSGFPKSLNIGKALDRVAGAEREVVGMASGMGKQNPEWNGTAQGRAKNSFKPEYEVTAPATDAAQRWDGWGTALKPSWEPVLVGRKPLS